MPLRLLEQSQMSARTAEVPLIAFWRWCCLVIDVDTFQLEFFFQIEVVMHHNTLAVLFRQQREQPFRIHG